MELFTGFLIALVILGSMGAAYGALVFTAGGFQPADQELLEIFYLFVLFALGHIAFYRMWRYILTRTAWRGVRFGLDGSAFRYFLLSSLWLAATVSTLGLAYPWYRAAIWRYRIDNLRFGNEHFHFEGRGGQFFKDWIVIYLLAAAFVFITVINGLFPLAIFGLPILWVWYRVREFNYVVYSTRFADTRFSLAMKVSPIVFSFVLAWLATVVIGGAIGLMVAPIVAALLWGSLGFYATFASYVVGIIILFGFWKVLELAILRYQIIAQFCRNFWIINPATFEKVTRSTRTEPEHGEGLADALDVGAI